MNIDTTQFDRDLAAYYKNTEQHPLFSAYQQVRDSIVADLSAEEVEAVPFNSDMLKADMVEHLRDVHNVQMIGQQTLSENIKMAKDELIRYHDRIHDAQSGTATLELRGRYTGMRTYGKEIDLDFLRRQAVSLQGFPVPKYAHRHVMPTLNEGASKVLAAVRNNQKVSNTALSVQDRKVLSELVNNDFNSLKQEMKAFAADALTAKKNEIEAEWDRREKSIPDFATQATDLHRKQEDEERELLAKHAAELKAMREKHQDARSKITDKAKDKGVTLEGSQEHVINPTTGNREYRTIYRATVQGRKDALSEAERANKQFLDRALMDLEKQRLTAQRQVLLSGVPDEAMPIVESIPDAKTMMVQAQEDAVKKQITT